MKHFPILIVQMGIVAEWLTLLGNQDSAVPMLGSACSSGKVDASGNDWTWWGQNIKSSLRLVVEGVHGGPMTSKQEHFPLLLVGRLKQCSPGAIRLLAQLIFMWPALSKISILVWNELVLSGKLKLSFKRRNFGPCHCLRMDLMHWLMAWLFSYSLH